MDKDLDDMTRDELIAECKRLYAVIADTLVDVINKMAEIKMTEMLKS